MPKKGDISKEKFTQDILNLYKGKAFVQDKNIYVNFTEDGEMVQLKISITAPKIPIDYNWEEEEKEEEKPNVDISDEEISNLKLMLERLNL